MLNPALFDPKEPLVTARFATVYGKDRQPGDKLPVGDNEAEGELPVGVALRLWLSGQAVYEKDFRPTPTESPEDAAQRLVEMDDLGGGWYLIRAPWLGEGEKVHGKDAADERRAAIIAKGDTKGVTITGGDGGWYSVDAPWLDEPLRVQGLEPAQVEEALLIQDGPPEGWTPETAEDKAARLQAAADAKANQERAEQEARERQEREAQEQADREAAEAKERERVEQLAAAGITVTSRGGGYYELAAPWLQETVKVRGKDAADEKAGELLASKPADDAQGTGDTGTTDQGDAGQQGGDQGEGTGGE